MSGEEESAWGHGWAIAYSVITLTLAPLLLSMFRQYFRTLDFLKMSYYFAVTMCPTAFSSELQVSVLHFTTTYLNFCKQGDFICTLGFPLSFAIVLVGILVVTYVVFVVVQCFRPSIQFQPIFLLFKGFFRWIYLPFIYESTLFFLKGYNSAPQSKAHNDHQLAIFVFIVTVAFPIVQLIGYKYIQKEDTPPYRKWTQFLGYMRLTWVGVMLGIYSHSQHEVTLHLAMIAILLYPLFHLVKGEFHFRRVERVIFGIGEAAFIVNYFLFKYGSGLVSPNKLDFVLLTIVLGLDLGLYSIRVVQVCCYGLREVKQEVEMEDEVAKTPPGSPKHADEDEIRSGDSGEEFDPSRKAIIPMNMQQ